MRIASSYFFILAVVHHPVAADPPPGSHPVFLIPGLTAASLESRNWQGFSVCNSMGYWRKVWDPLQGIPPNCFLHDLTVGGWDSRRNLSLPRHDCRVRVKGRATWDALLGTSDGINWGMTMHKLDEALQAVGYVRDKSLFAMAFDWRLGFNDWKKQTFGVLRTRIETATSLNHGSRAVLVTLSQGSMMVQKFFSWIRQEDPTWLDRHVESFVSAGGTYLGSGMVFKFLFPVYQDETTLVNCTDCIPAGDGYSMFPGDTLVPGLLNSQAFRSVLHEAALSFPGMHMLAPQPDTTIAPAHDPVVIQAVDTKNIPAACISAGCGATGTHQGWKFANSAFLGASQCGECMTLTNSTFCPTGFAEGARTEWPLTLLCCRKHQCAVQSYRTSELPKYLEKQHKNSGKMMEFAMWDSATDDPGVRTHCIFGVGVQTPGSFTLSEREETTMIDGDGIVHRDSLEVCSRWSSTVSVHRLPGVEHFSVLQYDPMVEMITNFALAGEASKRSNVKEAMGLGAVVSGLRAGGDTVRVVMAATVVVLLLVFLSFAMARAGWQRKTSNAMNRALLHE